MSQEQSDLTGEFVVRQLGLLPRDPVDDATTVVDLSWESVKRGAAQAEGGEPIRLTTAHIDRVCGALEAFTGKVSIKIRDQDLDDLKLIRIALLLASKNVKIVELDVSGNPRLSRNSLGNLARLLRTAGALKILHLGGSTSDFLAKEDILNGIIENKSIFEVSLGLIGDCTMASLTQKLHFLGHLRRISFVEGGLTRPPEQVFTRNPREFPGSPQTAGFSLR